MPAYNCGTEIDPILDHNLRVKFYNIKRDMSIDINDLVKQIDSSTAAILVIHYIGFPQPINIVRNICIDKKLFLIEDCAHALLSGNNSGNLGTYGDISVFSIRKTLPIPNGGALVINNKNFDYENIQINGSKLSTYFVAVEILKNRTQNSNDGFLLKFVDQFAKIVSTLNYFIRLFFRILKKISTYKGHALNHINYWSRDFHRDISKWKISKLSVRIMANTDYDNIFMKRRENYKHLLASLAIENNSHEILYKRLPEGVCPLFFPVIVKNRKYYHKTFLEKGISTFQYWQQMHFSVPWDQYPDAVYLKKCVLGLPIHQDICPEHLERIIRVFKQIQNYE
jgi:dTDP-4-amino-4,6-dideoxygalactose transaminase